MAFRRLVNQVVEKRMISMADNKHSISKIKTIENYVDKYFKEYYSTTIRTGALVGIVCGAVFGIVYGSKFTNEKNYSQFENCSHFSKSISLAGYSVLCGSCCGVAGAVIAAILPYGVMISVPFIPIVLVSSLAVSVSDYTIVKY